MRLFARRHDQELPLPAKSGTPAASAASATSPMAGVAGQRPPWLPDGKTHVEFAAEEALTDFESGRMDTGVANLTHALYVALTKREQVSEERARELFQQITNAAGCW